MSKIPYFPFYADDWIASRTRMELTYKQQGIYILLLAHSWRRPLPKEKELLHQLIPGARWTDIEFVLQKCFRPTPEGHVNDKLATLQQRATNISLKASHAGKCSYNKRMQSTNVATPVQRPFNQPEPEPEPEESIILPQNTEPHTPKSRFKKPTVAEIASYCQERKNNIDPQYFFDKNESCGWVYGKYKTPIKDWKAVIRTWEKQPWNQKPQPVSRQNSREGFA